MATRIVIGRNYLELEFVLPQQPLLPNEPTKGITSKHPFQLTLGKVFYNYKQMIKLTLKHALTP